jgi:hypothetical protein
LSCSALAPSSETLLSAAVAPMMSGVDAGMLRMGGEVRRREEEGKE